MASVEMPVQMQPQETTMTGQVLVCLGPSFAEPGSPHGHEKLLPLLESIADRIGGTGAGPSVLLAHPLYPSLPEEKIGNERIRSIAYTPASDASTLWLQTAADFRIARDLMVENQCTCCLLLGAEAQSIEPGTLLKMVEAVLLGRADLAVPCYQTEIDEALLNNALLYPLTRSIFGADIRSPLPVDLAMSARMCERMGMAAQKVPLPAQSTTLLWPVNEATVAGFSLAEVASGKRPEMHMGESDLNTVLLLVAGSLFSEVEAKAQYWQRTRPMAPVDRIGQNIPASSSETLDGSEAATLVDNFRLAYGSLHEIWALVLPPNSLLGLKKLSLLSVENFHMPDALWVRVVYDFLLAHRLRTINRKHLLGALTPLYLAWVATYVLNVRSGIDAKRHIESLTVAFEADKPYLVSRWRWPDRFNP